MAITPSIGPMMTQMFNPPSSGVGVGVGVAVTTGVAVTGGVAVTDGLQPYTANIVKWLTCADTLLFAVSTVEVSVTHLLVAVS